jgi:hypothetical protein
MRTQPILLVALVLTVTGVLSAQKSKTKSKTETAITILRKARPTTVWNARSAKSADVDCDGKPDTIVIGSEEGKVLVGVVWGAREKKPEVQEFGVARTHAGLILRCSYASVGFTA